MQTLLKSTLYFIRKIKPPSEEKLQSTSLPFLLLRIQKNVLKCRIHAHFSDRMLLLSKET